MRKPVICSSVYQEILALLSKKGVAVPISDADFNQAYEIVWAINAVQTAQWKIDHLNIGEYRR